MLQSNSNKFEKELLLSVDLKSWQETSTSHGTLIDHSVSPEIIDIYRKVMIRDDHTCHYCGFRSVLHPETSDFKSRQEIHHKNHDHTDFSESNLVTVCPLCHQAHHLNSAYINNGAELIWLPEITQQELNHLCRALFVANQIREESGGKYKNYISDLAFSYIWQTLLYNRKTILETKFGEGCSDLGKFAQVLLDIQQEQPKKYQNRSSWVKHFKLLPNPRRFHEQIQFWKEHNFKNLEIHNWVKLAKKLEVAMPEEQFKEMNAEPLV